MDETPSCQHTRLRVIAKDQDAEYFECLVCGAILEAEELPGKEAVSEKPGLDGSLSDA
jgi:hypothetical protein